MHESLLIICEIIITYIHKLSFSSEQKKTE